MNGQFPPSAPTTFPLASADAKRLAAALAASVAIHALAIFLPYLGQPAHPSLPKRPQPFAATLAISRPPLRIAELPPQAAAPSPAAPPAVEEKPAPPVTESAAGAGLLPLPAPAYYETDELTKRPQPQVLPDIDTPETKALVASGTLVLRLWIDDRGIVADAVVEKSDLPPIFGTAAVDAFKRSRFAPGERDGRRVGTVMRIEINYDDPRSGVR